MRAFPLVIAMAALSTVRCSVGRAQEVRHVQKAATAWSPPSTNLPKQWVDAAVFLQAHGLGDPRGGGYQKAKIHLGSVWSGVGSTVEESGWLLPDKTFL